MNVSQKICGGLCALLLSVLIEVVVGTDSAQGASASAGSSGWFVKPVQSDVGTWSSPFALNQPRPVPNITWSAGPNTTDGKVWSHDDVIENKLNGNTAPYSGRNLDGVTYSDGPGPRGSFAISTGFGRSAGPLTSAPPAYTARYTVIATGALGNLPPPPTVEYASSTRARNPWELFSSDLSSITGPQYDLYFNVEIGVSDLTGPSASASWTAFYETALDTEQVLKIAFDATGVNVLGNPLATYYRLPSLESNPITEASSFLSLTQIRQILTSDLAGDNRIDSALYLGILLDDLTIPTLSMADGALAMTGVGIGVGEAATVPEPETYVMLLAGLSLLGFVSRCRKLNFSSTVAA